MAISIKGFVKDSFLLSAGQILGTVFTFIQGVLIARSLGPAQYGLWGIVIAYSALIYGFLGFRTGEPLTKYLVEYRVKKKLEKIEILIHSAIFVDFITRLMGLGVILLSAGLTANTLGHASMWSVYVVYGFSSFFSFLDNTWYTLLKDRKRFKLISLFSLSFVLLQFFASCLLLGFARLTLLNFAYTVLIISFFKSFIYVMGIRWELKKAYKINLNRINIGHVYLGLKSLNGFWKFMVSTYVSSMISSISKNADFLFLGYFRPTAEVGIYRLAKNLVAVIQIISTTFTTVIYPRINEMIQSQNVKTLRSDLWRMMRYGIPAAFIVVAVLDIFSKYLFIRIYGSGFSQATEPFYILSVQLFFTLISFWLFPLLYAFGQYRFTTQLILGTTVLNVVLLIFFSSHGVLAVSTISSLVGVTSILIMFVKAKSILKDKVR